MAEIVFRSVKMADRQNHSLNPLPTANYSSAIARAVEWLGDRYLLAKPINAAPSGVTPTVARVSPRLRRWQAHR
jgi:hypothetical protein